MWNGIESSKRPNHIWTPVLIKGGKAEKKGEEGLATSDALSIGYPQKRTRKIRFSYY